MTGSDAPLGAGLWMWVITTEDLSVTAFTPHSVCRYGDMAYKSPTCAFWDCLNADCSSCESDSAEEKALAQTKASNQTRNSMLAQTRA